MTEKLTTNHPDRIVMPVETWDRIIRLISLGFLGLDKVIVHGFKYDDGSVSTEGPVDRALRTGEMQVIHDSTKTVRTSWQIVKRK